MKWKIEVIFGQKFVGLSMERYFLLLSGISGNRSIRIFVENNNFLLIKNGFFRKCEYIEFGNYPVIVSPRRRVINSHKGIIRVINNSLRQVSLLDLHISRIFGHFIPAADADSASRDNVSLFVG